MKDSSKKTLREVLSIGLRLFLICTVVSVCVALAFSLTDAKYKENLREEKRKAIIGIFQSETLSYADLSESLGKPIYEVKEGEALLGYCVESSGSGFGGDVQLMVGFLPDGSILGVKIVTHSETPGLGARVDDPAYLSQYEGKSGALSFGNGVDAISGASISSRAVLDGVNEAVKILQTIGGQS